MNDASIDISVVIPVYNGENFIAETTAELIEYLAGLDERAELIIVDDGSTDQTGEIIDRAAANAPIPVRVEHLSGNQGKGAAITRGMSQARGRYRVFLDSDLAYPPEAIAHVCAQLSLGADVVIGSRVHSESRYVVQPSFFRYLYTRHVAGRVFNWLVRLVLLPGIRDSQAGLKGFTAEAADALFGAWLPTGFSFDLAILARARRAGLRIEQIPIVYRYDSEPTTVRFMGDTAKAIRDLVVVRLRIGGATYNENHERLRVWAKQQATRLWSAATSSAAGYVAAALCGLGLIGLVLFLYLSRNSAAAMVSWFVAISAFLVLVRRSELGRGNGGGGIFADGCERFIFLLILGLTAFLRFWRLGTIPPTIHGDSAECGIHGLDILLGRVSDIFGFSPWYHTPYLAHLPYAASFALVGRTVVGLRLPSAIVGTLAVIPLYFLVRGWFGRRAAVIASLLFALSHAAIHFSRIGLWNIQVLFLELVSFACLAFALRTGRAVPAAWAGITAGLALYSYTGGRLILVVAMALLGVQFVLGPRRWLIRTYGVFLAGLMVAALPIVLSWAEYPDVIAADRSSSVMVLAEATREHVMEETGQDTVAGILRVQTTRSLAGFITEGDHSGQYATSQPLVSPITAVLAAAGFLIAVLRFRETESRLVVLWAVLGLVLGSVLIIDPPSATRLIMVFPVPFILAALTLETLFGFMARVGIPHLRRVVGIMSVLFIIQSAIFNLGGYRKYVALVDREAREWDVIQAVGRFGNDYDYYVFGGPWLPGDAPSLRLFGEGKRMTTGITSTDIPDRLARDTVFIVIPHLVTTEPEFFDIGTVITENFPEARRELVSRDGEPQVILYVAAAGGVPPPPETSVQESR